MSRFAEPIRRFTPAQRWIHRATAALMVGCLLTAAILYIAPLSVLVGRRDIVVDIHVVAGLGLPVPALAGLLSRAFRSDLRRLNRFTATDWQWLRSRDRRSGRLPIGKFNAGQKLYASVVTGGALVLLATGVLMRFGGQWPLALRIGATFVHDWMSYVVAAAVVGHVVFALRDPVARAGMRTGWVPGEWAAVEHGAWADERPAR